MSTGTDRARSVSGTDGALMRDIARRCEVVREPGLADLRPA